MTRLSLLKNAVIALAAVGVVFPAPMVRAAASAPVKVIQTDASVLDIGLTQQGVFAGRVVDHTGTPAANQAVEIRQGQQVVAKATSDAQGRFAVKGLKGGVYEVASGATVGTYRVWNETSAPPAAQEQALLILGQNGTRGNFGAIGGGKILLAAVVITALILAIIAIDEANDDDDDSTP